MIKWYEKILLVAIQTIIFIFGAILSMAAIALSLAVFGKLIILSFKFLGLI